MASIRINEIDNSTFVSRQLTNDNIVVVSGTRGRAKSKITSSGVEYGKLGIAADNTFVLCRSLRDFYENFGEIPFEGDILGWEYAANILRAGFPVLYYSYPQDKVLKDAKMTLDELKSDTYLGKVYMRESGSDWKSGWVLVTDNKLIDDDSVDSSGILSNYKLLNDKIADSTKLSFLPTTTSETAQGVDQLIDRINYRIKFIPTVYFADGSIDAVSKFVNIVDDSSASDEYSAPRGDCLILADYSDDYVLGACSDYDNNAKDPKKLYSGSSYVAIASPTAQFISPLTGNVINKMPASFFILKTLAEGYSSGLSISNIWAGAKRGVINNVGTFNERISMQQMRKWTDKGHIIPLMEVPPYGNLIYGNSTRLHDYNQPSNSALDSLNVRLVANEIKRAIHEVCLGLTFETNDIILWTEFKEKMSKVLDSLRGSRAIRDYRIIMDESVVTSDQINNLTVPGIIRVDINRAAENFDITFEITPAGVNFNEVVL